MRALVHLSYKLCLLRASQISTCRLNSITMVQATMQLLVGDVLLSAACIAYYGAFPGDYRQELVSGWVEKCRDFGIPVSPDCTLRGVLASPIQVLTRTLLLQSAEVSGQMVCKTMQTSIPSLLCCSMQEGNWLPCQVQVWCLLRQRTTAPRDQQSKA